MAYMNATNTKNETSGLKAFSYVNTTLGKEFPLVSQSGVLYESERCFNDWLQDLFESEWHQ